MTFWPSWRFCLFILSSKPNECQIKFNMLLTVACTRASPVLFLLFDFSCFEIFFSFFPEIRDYCVSANCLHGRLARVTALPLRRWLKCGVEKVNWILVEMYEGLKNKFHGFYRYISSLIMRLFYVRSSLTHRYIYLHKSDRVYRRIIKTDQQRGKQRVTRSNKADHSCETKRLITTSVFQIYNKYIQICEIQNIIFL